jgi:hypothetical protein
VRPRVFIIFIPVFQLVFKTVESHGWQGLQRIKRYRFRVLNYRFRVNCYKFRVLLLQIPGAIHRICYTVNLCSKFPKKREKRILGVPVSEIEKQARPGETYEVVAMRIAKELGQAEG